MIIATHPYIMVCNRTSFSDSKGYCLSGCTKRRGEEIAINSEVESRHLSRVCMVIGQRGVVGSTTRGGHGPLPASVVGAGSRTGAALTALDYLL